VLSTPGASTFGVLSLAGKSASQLAAGAD
jgi:hypothetical protein